MISRVAESAFWMQRYVERAEATARLLGAYEHGASASQPLYDRWQPLLIVTGELPRFQAAHGDAAVDDRDTVLRELTWSAACPVSVWTSWYHARENARVIRETLSEELWLVANRTWLWIEDPTTREAWERDPSDFYRAAREAGQLFVGAAEGTMLDDEPIRFMRLGLWLERVGQVARIIDMKHHEVGPTVHDKTEDVEAHATWVRALTACGAHENYFRRNRGTVRGYRVVRFLVFDPTSPRSILYGLKRAQALLEEQRRTTRQTPSAAESELDMLVLWLEGLGWRGMIEMGIHEVMTLIVDGVAEVCSRLYTDYFDPPLTIPQAT